MQMIVDILLGAGALGAAFYCMVLSHRLKKFTRLENGMGGAIAVLSGQVDQMTKVLEAARAAAHSSADTLEAKTARGEKVAERLELILAAMHDLPSGDGKAKGGARSPGRAAGKNARSVSSHSGETTKKSVTEGLPAVGGSDTETKADGAGEHSVARADAPVVRARFVRRRVSRSDSEAA